MLRDSLAGQKPFPASGRVVTRVTSGPTESARQRPRGRGRGPPGPHEDALAKDRPGRSGDRSSTAFAVPCPVPSVLSRDPCRRCGAHLPAGGVDLRVCSACRRELFRAYDLRAGDPVTTVRASAPAPPSRFIGYDVRDGRTVAAVRRGEGPLAFVPVEDVWRVAMTQIVRPCTGEHMPVPPA